MRCKGSLSVELNIVGGGVFSGVLVAYVIKLRIASPRLSEFGEWNLDCSAAFVSPARQCATQPCAFSGPSPLLNSISVAPQTANRAATLCATNETRHRREV